MTTMTFDQVLDTWRTQDQSPAYSVNRDLLQLVLQQEQRPMRRSFLIEAWMQYVLYAGFFVGAALFFLMIFWERNYGDEPRQFWGYHLAVVTAALCLGGGVALWISRRRQALRERRFGNTLRDELQRHLSLIDYALSRRGRMLHSLLTMAPFGALGVMVIVLSAVVNGLRINTMRILWMAMMIGVVYSFLAYRGSRDTVKTLAPRRQRLVFLLKDLDEGDRSGQ